MKKIILILIFAVSFAMVFNACSGNSTKKTEQTAEKIQYTCPMHPEVIQDKPGKCPKCGMDLVKKETADTTTQMHNHSDSSMNRMK